MVTKVTKAAGYIRVSSDVQIHGESLSTQKKQIRNYCKAREWKLVKIYEDKGYSGSTIKRPAFQFMMDGAKDGRFEILVIRDLSRAARNSRELLNVVEELKQYNVSITSIKENIDFTGPYGEAMLTILSAVVQLELSVISERMKENKFARWAEGRTFVGKPPYGYRWNKKDKRLEIVPKEAEIYKRIVKMYLDEGLSMKAIALKLSDEGIKCKRAKFSSPVISYMIKNTAYYGNYVLNKKKYVYNPETGRHSRTNDEKPASEHINFNIPAIIDKGTFDLLQEKTKFNKIKSKRPNNANEAYWLRDILRCGVCGGKIVAHHGSRRKDGTFPRYYSCYWSTASPQTLSLSEKKDKCILPHLKAKRIETRVWLRIRDRMGLTLSGIKAHAKLGKGTWKQDDDGLTVLLDGWESPLKDLKKQQERIKNELKKLNRKRQRVLGLLNDDDFNKNEMSSLLQENRNDILGKEAKLKELVEKIADLSEFAENRKFFSKFAKDNRKALEQIREEMDTLTPRHKKLIIESMTPEILITPIDMENTIWESMQFRSWNVKKQVFYKLAEEGALPTLKSLLNKNGSHHFTTHDF